MHKTLWGIYWSCFEWVETALRPDCNIIQSLIQHFSWMSHSINSVKFQMYGFTPAAVTVYILIKIQLCYAQDGFMLLPTWKRGMSQIFNEHQGHSDTFTWVKAQSGGSFVVKNVQVGLFVSCVLWSHPPSAACCFLKAALRGKLHNEINTVTLKVCVSVHVCMRSFSLV